MLDTTMRYWIKQVVILLLLPMLLACSNENRREIKLLNTSEEMQKEVSRFITVGMSVKRAKQIMEDSGFECTDFKNNRFAIEKTDQYGMYKQTIVRGDFLHCGKERSYFLASQNWQVALLYKKDKVTMISASVNWQNL